MQRGPRTAPFDDVMERGYLLAAYDKAATLGTAAVHPEEPLRSIAVATKAGWVVRFGKLDKQRNSFLVSYEALPEQGGYRAVAVEPPRIERGFTAAAARAVELTTAGPHQSRAVVPSPDGNLFVYSYPAVTRSAEAFIGPDLRQLVSSDGNTVLATRVMHATETRLEVEVGGTRSASVVHRHRNEELEDTDVAFSIEYGMGQFVILPSKAAIMVNEFGVPHQFTEAEMRDLLNRKQ